MPYIRDIDEDRAALLIRASIQAYNAFDTAHPTTCYGGRVTCPDGYEFVDCWTGVDEIIYKTTEIFGIVLRSVSAPYRYVFAFRGTWSYDDIVVDMEEIFYEQSAFVPYGKSTPPVPEAKVAAGFWSAYTAASSVAKPMQQQLFELIGTYQSSDKPITELYITGHSLGAALCELFTLDIALAKLPLKTVNYNYACPPVGGRAFVDFYDQQPAQRDPSTRTVRIQNTYDYVPCLGLGLGWDYGHVPYAYLVAFHHGRDWEIHPVVNHSAAGYQAVMDCAFASPTGYCLGHPSFRDGSKVYQVTSVEPNPNTVCNFWPEQKKMRAAALESKATETAAY